MLTQIRHIQKGTLIVVTILIVIAFAFLYSDFDFVQGTVGRQDCVVKVYDRCYRQKEVSMLANHYDVAIQLGMYDFVTVMFGEDRMDDDRTNFIMSLIILRKEAEKMGINPSEEEIKEAIPKLPIFQQPLVSADYVKNSILGPNGFTDGDFAQLVKDYLSFQKLRDLIGAGVAAVPSETDLIYTKRNQRYHASLVKFDRAKFADTLKITDAEVKEYFEANTETLQADPKRGFDYAKFTPKKLPDDATAEQKANSARDFGNAVNRVYADLADDDADFVKIAKANEGSKQHFEMKVGKFEAFPPVSPPEELKDKGEILKELFTPTLQIDDVSIPVATGDGGYYVFHYGEVIEPRPLTLEEATEAINTVLKNRKSDRLVNDAANEARAKIVEALEAGKPFAGVVKEAGLEVEKLDAFSRAEPPEGRTDASTVLGAAEEAGTEKSVSAVISQPNGEGYFLVYVDKIDIFEDEEKDSAKRSMAASTENSLRRSLFTAWFNQRRLESGSARDPFGGKQTGEDGGTAPDAPAEGDEAPAGDPS
ncbi:peptidyl-prolyl cis-trans isomerase [Verrucomicrobiales bacterium]|jgi:peptidyl-prolyl cis-trans isomerase D|nr:peptidyl-prolyl cis-trans isomerase [Verrucomicrobiales bacterium]MDB3940684.1 peptidyl-prolyl cis-trans isomerase [Verrucomicrobiales bacterium]